MSRQVDERVVSMQFDNRNFEKNVSKSMSTLDKFKQKLNLTGASKGLENVNAAAQKVDMKGLASGVETVSAKFSALEVMGVTALANITNSAVNAGKNLAKSLSIDQIMAGYSKYDQKTASVQTIMNATGKTIDEVNTYLNKLMWFSDETSYSFTDMTSALAQMTSSGGDIDKLIPLITGVANATAFAGKGAREFSSAMYNLNQSYSKGYLDYTDWKSIDLMGVSSKQLKQTIIDTAVAMGKLGKGQVTIDNFASTLSEKWADRNVMEAAFGKFAEFSEAVNKLVNGDITDFSKEIQDLYNAGEIETAADAIEALSEHYDDLGVKAFKSAQEAKTFTEAIDATKDAVSSGWMRTFEIIFGTYEQAKKTWTSLANWLWDVFASGAEGRNAFLEDLMTYNPMTAFVKKLESVSEAVGNVSKAVQDYSDIVNKVIRGDFGNGRTRLEKLTEAGWEYAEVQNRVNEKLGSSVRIATKASQAQKEQTKMVTKLSDAKLKELGLTKEEIALYRDLEEQSEKTGKSINELISEMEAMDGRTLLLDSFKNIGDTLLGVFQALKEAWSEIFPAPTVVQIYNILDGFHKLTEALRITDKETGELNETGQKIKRTFKGLFAIIDLIATFVGTVFKTVFGVVADVFGLFKFDVLETTASIGDMLVAFRVWVKDNDYIVIACNALGDALHWIITKIKELVNAVKNSSIVQKIIGSISDTFKKVADAFKNVNITDVFKNMFGNISEFFTDSESIGSNVVSGLVSGLTNGAKKIWNAVTTLAKGMLDAIKNFLGIHSPSTKFKEVGENAISGLLNGLKTGIGSIIGVIKELCSKMVGAFSGLDWSSISTIFTNIARLFPKLKIFNAISAIGNIAVASGQDVTTGLANGIGKGASAVMEAIRGIATSLLDTFKNILGIHSPSKVMFAIGGFLIAGLIGGLLGGTTNIKTSLQTIGATIIDFFSGLDIGAVITTGTIIASLLLVKKTLDIVKDFASAAKGVGELTSSLGNLVNTLNDGLIGKFKPSKWTEISNAILKVAIAVGILVAAVVIMSKIEPAKLWGAIGALGTIIVAVAALAGIIAGLMAATKLINANVGIKDVGNTLLKIAATMAIMVIVVKMASKMSIGEITQGSIAIIAFSGIIVGLMAATKLISGSRNVDRIGKTLFKMASAILVMLLVAKIAASMSPKDLVQGGLAIVAFSGILVGLMAATKLINGSKNVDTIGTTLFKISAAILVMLLVAKIAASMSPKELLQGGVAIAAFSGILIGLMAATKLINGSKNVGAIGSTLFKIAAAIMIMVLVAKIAATMNPSELAQGLLAITAFSGIIVGLMAATKLICGSTNVDKVGGTLFKIAAAILVMTLVAKIAASMSPGELAQGLLAITAFSGIIVGLMAATKLITGSKNIDKIGNALIKVAIVIGVMAASVALLSLIKPERLSYATGALVTLMGTLSLVLVASKNLTKNMGSLIVLTAIIIALAGALFWVGQLPAESAMTSAVALSMVLLALSASLVILSTIGKFTKDALMGVLALLAMAVPLLAFVGILYLMQGIQNVIPSVMALVTLTTAMTLLLIPLTIVGAFGMAGLPYLGVLALLAMAVPLLAFVGILALMQNIQNAEQNAMILIKLMTTMTTCLVAVSLVAPLALLASTAILALIGTITIVGVLIAAIGALVTEFPQIEEFLDTGLPILEKIAYGIGSIFGNMISGFAVSAMSGLPEMGMLLSQFMINAMPFIAGAKMIDATTMDGVKSLAEVILILTAADVIQGLTSWLTGGSSIASFGEEIAAFGPSIKAFADSVSGIDCESVQAAANAAKALAEMTATIPNEGGVAGWFAGENSISKFASELPGLGTNLKIFSDNVAGISAENITAAAEAAKAIAEMTSSIPNEGGVAAWFAGENSISKFASDLPGLGEGLKGFSDNVAGISAENVNAAVEAAKAICEMSNNIPNEGGVASWFAGDNSISNFSSQLGDLGTAINTFATNVGNANVENINRAVTATKSLSKLLSTDVSKNSDIMSKFGEKLVDFGKKISEFCKKMSDIKDDVVSSAIDKLNKMVNMAATLNVDSISSMTKFSDTLVEVAKNGIKEFVSTLNSKSVKYDANNAISDLVSDTADGIETWTNKSKFKSAGKYLIEGLAEGIRNNKSTATKAAQEVADAVEKIIRSAWQVNSPSKLFYRIALGIGEGIEYALGDSTYGVTRSARDLADTTSKGFGNAISKVNELFGGTFDTQPTIRPVLDLSDVQSGANSIAGMFSGNRTLAISAPGIGAISASMANRQNGNNDLVSAINKLAKSNGKSGDTYNFNGFSYSESSDVADAIKTLTRAITIEGRT